MRLYLRGKIWWLDVTVAGQRHRLTTRETKKRAAKRSADGHIALLREGAGAVARKPTNLTLAEVWERYRPIAATKASARSIEHAMTKLLGYGVFAKRHHLDPERTLSSLTQQDIEALIEARRIEGMKAGSINLEIANLSAMLTWAEDRLGIPKPRLRFRRLKSQQPMRRLLIEEVTALLDYLDPAGKGLHQTQATLRQDIYDMVLLALHLGCRHSEICSIHWSNVDRTNWQTVGIWRRKTTTEDRLSMTSEVADVLKRRYAERRSRHWVFPSRADPEKHRAYSTKGFRSALERAGLNDPTTVSQRGMMTFHGLRRTFASLLADEGISLYDIQSMLGHSTPTMAQRYAKLATNRASQRSAEGIARAFGKR